MKTLLCLCLIIAALLFIANLANQSPTPTITPVAQRTRVPQSLVAIEANSLLAAYRADEDTGSQQYKGRKVLVTGILTGVFIPTVEVSRGLAEKGYAARAFVTMAGPEAYSAMEAFSLPGISAHSVEGSLFGQENALIKGETVSLNCEVGWGMQTQYGGKADYSLSLDDCTLQNKRVPSLEAETSRPKPASAPPASAESQGYVPTQTVEKGQTPEQVQAVLGKPDEIVNLGTRVIYVYKDLAKVTFVDGKVSDAE